MADRRNRAPVKARVVALAEGLDPIDLGVEGRTAETIPVSYDTPPDTATSTCFYFGASGPVDGTAAPSAISSRQPMTDEFEISGKVDVYGFESAADAEEAAERALVAFETVLLECSRLIHPDDEVATEKPVYDCEKAYITAASLLSGRYDAAKFAARYEFTVTVTTDIRYPS